MAAFSRIAVPHCNHTLGLGAPNWPNSQKSVAVNDYGFDCINRPDIMPVLALLLDRRKLLAAMITLHHPAPHQKISTESEANHPVVTANGFRK